MSTTQQAVMTVEISNECTCPAYRCMDCDSLTYEENFCEECGLELDMGDGAFDYYEGYECPGHCFEDASDAVSTVWEEFKEAVPSESGFYVIEGSDIGWRRLSGYRVIEATVTDIWEQVSVRSEWTQRWTFDPQARTLVVTQAHHDAPMGESYVFTPSTKKEIEAMEGYL